MELDTEDELPCFQGGSHVKTLVTLESKLEFLPPGLDSFLSWHEWFRKRDPNSYCLRTSPHLGIEVWSPLSEPLPTSGIAVNGEFTPLGPSEPPTNASDSFLLPTLTARMGERGWGFSQTGRHRVSPPVEALVFQIFGRDLSPEFAEWHMGFPEGWTSVE
jgi:hypothetical protein